MIIFKECSNKVNINLLKLIILSIAICIFVNNRFKSVRKGFGLGANSQYLGAKRPNTQLSVYNIYHQHYSPIAADK